MTTPDRRALVVDLDGTLIKSDLLVESACVLLGQSPFNALLMGAWLAGGRAFLKRRIAERAEIDVSLLPYNEAVLERIRAAREAGHPVYLASASDECHVAAVARHLGLFDGWFGSDGVVNLRGDAKAARLVGAFGERGFDYIADSAVDLPVWRRAHTAVVLGRSEALAQRASRVAVAAERLALPRTRLRTWLSLLRPHHWAKNALVAVALITSHSFTLAAAVEVLLSFVAFSLCASSVYVLNDLVDLRTDRGHPRKRRRPLASGAVPLLQGALLAPIILAGGVAASLLVSRRFAAVLGVYYAVTVVYSFAFKRKMMVDVITLAGLYTIRVVAGAIAIEVFVSQWILAFSMFVFLALALIKRYSELVGRLDAGLPDPTNRNYRVGDLPVVLSLAAAAGYSAVIVFSLYLASDSVTALYRWPEVLWLAVPLLVYWISRMLVMANRRLVDEDPILFALRDRVSLLTGAVLLALTMWAYLVPNPMHSANLRGRPPATRGAVPGV
jgi:4-hydroxybenzoate polyprenyltransferase/phosphoserine phosphatase